MREMIINVMKPQFMISMYDFYLWFMISIRNSQNFMNCKDLMFPTESTMRAFSPTTYTIWYKYFGSELADICTPLVLQLWTACKRVAIVIYKHLKVAPRIPASLELITYRCKQSAIFQFMGVAGYFEYSRLQTRSLFDQQTATCVLMTQF